MSDYQVEIELPDIVRTDHGTLPRTNGAVRWTPVGNPVNNRSEAEISYEHLADWGARVRLVRYGADVVRHWQDAETELIRQDLRDGKSSRGRMVIHPDSLTELMTTPGFFSAIGQPEAEPGEIGRITGSPSGIVRVFVSPSAPRRKLPEMSPLRRLRDGLEKKVAGLRGTPEQPGSWNTLPGSVPAVGTPVSEDSPRVPRYATTIPVEHSPEAHPSGDVSALADSPLRITDPSDVVSTAVWPLSREVGDARTTLPRHLRDAADARRKLTDSNWPLNVSTSEDDQTAVKGSIAQAAPETEELKPLPVAGNAASLDLLTKHLLDEHTRAARLSSTPAQTDDTYHFTKQEPAQAPEPSTVTPADVQAVIDGKLLPGEPGFVAAYQAASVMHRFHDGVRTSVRTGN